MPATSVFIPLIAFAMLAAPAAAQTTAEPQTRAEELRRQREEKERNVKPYEENGLERAMDLAEGRIYPLLIRDGLYLRFGSLTTGSGFAYGGGYRDRSFVKGRGSLDLWAAGSIKRYWALEAKASYPLAPRDRLRAEGYVRKYDYPQEDFFGIGPDSQRSNRTTFDINGEYVGGQLIAQPVKPLTFGGGVEYLWPTVSRGRNRRFPSIDDIFDDVSAPGLQAEHEFVRALGHVTFDYRQPLNARKGGYYRFDVSRYDNQRDVALDFTRVDVELRQFISFLAERRVLAARIRVSTTDVGETDRVPFFLLPTLGGNDTLRGFRAYRFRGQHAMLLQGEYRWEIWSAFDGAIFYDAGKVAVRREDLNFKALEHDYGIGFRFNTDNGIVVRVDAAFGSKDGKHLHIVFGGIF
jgi:surface antigen Omp85-like protein